jgi:hypothetical protein
VAATPAKAAREPQDDPVKDVVPCVVTVVLDDLELDLSFRSASELSRVSMFDLKAALAVKLSGLVEEGVAMRRLVRPEELEFRLGEAVLREYWTGRDIGLHDESVIVAGMRDPGAAGLTAAALAAGELHPLEQRRVLLSVNLNIGAGDVGSAGPAGSAGSAGTAGTVVPVTLREGDSADVVAAEVVRKLGMDEEQAALPVACELYKQLSLRLARENVTLRNQVAELRRQLALAARPAAAAPKSRETYEALLASAAAQLKAVEADKAKMADQVFELRLKNADRLAREM